MEYSFQAIEEKWKKYWAEQKVYKVINETNKPKCYVLDMFPYPSGAGLHVGHPLGYIASDIYARYKRMKGYNVLHPMGFDAFGLPAEQYAIETGQHPKVTTEKNIKRYKEQLDKIGFCYDWDRAVITSDPKYYKWTQWIFLQLFHSWYDRTQNKARPIDELLKIFEKEGNVNHSSPGDESMHFDAAGWNDFSEKEQRDILMHYRLAYLGYAQVWWCEALGTVLANDEVVNGVSERGGFPVERKNMRQWFLRITEYAERLLNVLDTLDWTEAMKEMQRNWIGKSVGAEVEFGLTPALSKGEGGVTQDSASPHSENEALSLGEGLGEASHGWQTADQAIYDKVRPLQRDFKNDLTEAENILWQNIRNKQLGVKFRRQHVVGKFIADFICLPAQLIIEVDGKIHEQQKEADAQRTEYLKEKGFRVIRFTNEEVIEKTEEVIEKIKRSLTPALSKGEGDVTQDSVVPNGNEALSLGEGLGEAKITVFTTRPDTIFGVDFMVLAPEHELVDTITTKEQRAEIEKYKQYVKSRSERERMSDVKQITGCFTGAYAIHPFTGRNIPVWTSEYVLAGYGTGAIMAVPSGDERDHAFAKHFNIPITNIFGSLYTGNTAYSAKTGKLENSNFLSGMNVQQAMEAAINALEDIDAGKRKVNYKMHDAGFSRQRYWGEPFPIIYVDDIPYGIDEPPIKDTPLNKLPVELPYVESYKPGPEGQGPLANIKEWTSPQPSPQVEREVASMFGNIEKRRNAGTKYSLQLIKQYELARLNRKNATEAENLLWQNLRGNKLGEKFRRQHPIESYIVDFVCLNKGLIIEVDGEYHSIPEQVAYDDDRTKTLEELGFRVVRFTNEMILEHTDDVLTSIKNLLKTSGNNKEQVTHPSPPVERGRGEVSRETSTMPGYAGSSWYFLRYMDPHNDNEFANRAAIDYWQQVDLYVGGTEHAVGHLLYARMWTKALYDLGYIGFDEPFKKLLNQGMIQGVSQIIWRYRGAPGAYTTQANVIPFPMRLKSGGAIMPDWDSLQTIFYSDDFLKNNEPLRQQFDPIHIPIQFANNNSVNIEELIKFSPEKYDGVYVTDTAWFENGKWKVSEDDYIGSHKFYASSLPEKMSKSKYNVVNPDDIVVQYSADTFRMYEMFLGPVEMSKPWDTKGIEGVHRFLKKMWRLYADETGWLINSEPATDAELRILHKTIKKISEDIERFSFNTSVSQFMICVNELSALNCHKREILEPLAIAICPFAPHLAEELWHNFGNEGSIVAASFPQYEAQYVTENTKKYPVAVNGKTRIEMEFPLDAEQSLIEKEVLADATILKWMEGKEPKKFIYVKGKMINVVV